MSLLDGLDSFLREIADAVGSGVSRLTDLETAVLDKREDVEPTIFALKDGSLMTMIKIRGHRMMVGVEEFESGSSGLFNGLNGLMKQAGHSIVFHYRYNPDDKSIIHRCVNGMKASARSMDMNMDDVVEDWGDAVSRYVSNEEIWLSVVTRPSSMNRQERKKAVAKMSKEDIASPFKGDSGDTQRVTHFVEELRTSHEAFVSSLMSTLSSPRVSVIAEVEPVRSAMVMIRSIVSPATGRGWKPVIPGDRLPILLKDTPKGFRPDYICYPSFPNQLFDNDRNMVDPRTVRWGNRYFRAISVSVPPLNETSFNRLFERLQSDAYSWSMSFHIDGDGLSSVALKDVVSTILAPLSSVNRQIHRANKWLTSLSESSGEAIVRLRMTLRVDAESMELLDRGVSEVIAALQSWQSCNSVIPLGSAQATACGATVPGLLSKSPSPAAAAPLAEVIQFLPWTRPANIWDTGMMFRTNDGRAFPWLQGSSKQTAFIDVGLGPMGTGKSVNLNSINLGFILTPGLVRLPMLSILDIGPSSLGLITTIQNALPKEKAYLATYVRLRMDPERYAINVFDLPIGCDRPFPSHMAFLINFLMLLQTPIGDGKTTPPAPDYAQGISRRLVVMAYERLSNDQPKPKTWEMGRDANSPDFVHVEKMIREMGFHVDSHTSWHDLVKMFFDKGMLREAEICQRHAMPNLVDLLGLVNDQSIVDEYGEESVKFYRRALSEAIAAYPIIARTTRFSIGEARIVSLDMDEVAAKGSPLANRQSGVMFMVARHILISRFFVQDEDVRLVPDHYQSYHKKRIADLRLDPKRIVFDELHRFVKDDNPVVSAQVVADVSTIQRESRKWNLHLGLYSQEPTDIPEELAGMTSSVFIMGVNGSEAVADRADKLFSFGSTATNAMISGLRKPDRGGSHMIARILVDGQPVTRHLRNTLGPILMWGLTSTTEDSRLINRLYRSVGSKVARKAMATLYPGGSIKDLFERMRMAYADGEYLSEEDREIYREIASRQSTTPDTLDVIYEKTLRWIKRRADENPREWS